MYIKNRYDRDGNIIESPNTYTPKHTKELQDFLNEMYSKDIGNLDQKNS